MTGGGPTGSLRAVSAPSRRRVPRALVIAAAGLVAVPAASVAADPPYRAVVRTLSAQERAEMTPSVWRPGCPVGLAALRHVSVPYVGFGGRVRRGAVVVHNAVARDVVEVFRALYKARFPIRRMQPIQRHGGDDYASIEADNTSAFNCRRATGASTWSQHAYGRAIDLNPLENPYVSGGTTSHPRSLPYLDRRPRRGVIVEGGVVTRAFDARGWEWGGRWGGIRDYQHFSADGG